MIDYKLIVYSEPLYSYEILKGEYYIF